MVSPKGEAVVLNIEFGCGETINKGFVGCDVREFPHVKYICNAWEIMDHGVEPDSVHCIYSRHFLEHLTLYEANKTLEVWNKILIPGGMLMITVPDVRFHMAQWMHPKRKELLNYSETMTVEQWAITGLWGHQRETDQGEVWDIHKSGYDFELLNDKLIQHGFKGIIRHEDLPKNLSVECTK